MLTSFGTATFGINLFLAQALWPYQKAWIQVGLAIVGFVCMTVGLGLLRFALKGR
jgi:hypothetical protein